MVMEWKFGGMMDDFKVIQRIWMVGKSRGNILIILFIEVDYCVGLGFRYFILFEINVYKVQVIFQFLGFGFMIIC